MSVYACQSEFSANWFRMKLPISLNAIGYHSTCMRFRLNDCKVQDVNYLSITVPARENALYRVFSLYLSRK